MLDAYLKAGQVVSSSALAAVLINVDFAHFSTDLTWSQIRIVLRCKANSEPMLVNAVRQATPPSDVVLPCVEAACVKVAVYRDSITVPWSEFVQAPVRYILAVLQPLLVCSTCGSPPSADCVRWHSQEGLPPQPVLDLWRRQWTSFTFQAM